MTLRDFFIMERIIKDEEEYEQYMKQLYHEEQVKADAEREAWDRYHWETHVKEG